MTRCHLGDHLMIIITVSVMVMVDNKASSALELGTILGKSALENVLDEPHHTANIRKCTQGSRVKRIKLS